MRRIMQVSGTLALGVIGVGAAMGQGVPRAGSPVATPRATAAPVARETLPRAVDSPAATARMEELLQAWAQRSARTKTLDASYTRVDRSPVWSLETHYKGRALLVAPNLACIDLQKAKPKPGEDSFHERIICTGDKVYHYQATKQIFIYPLDQQDRKRALEEGPLPFLFNMRVEEAKKRYKMVLVREDKTHVLIQIIPLLPIDRENFIQAVVRLDKEKFLPDALTLVEPNGKDTQNYAFTRIDRDVEVKESNFRPPLPTRTTMTGWKVIDNTNGNPATAAPSTPAVSEPGAAVPRPALQPSASRRLRN